MTRNLYSTIHCPKNSCELGAKMKTEMSHYLYLFSYFSANPEWLIEYAP